MMGNWYGWNMMGGGTVGLLSTIVTLLVIALLVVLIRYFWNRGNK